MSITDSFPLTSLQSGEYFAVDKYMHIRECTSKQRYDTETLAKSTSENIFLRDGTILRVYQCRWCSGWHLNENLYLLALNSTK